ncbi:hypothetical protein GCM10007937_14620 [Mesorhizobium albiziae]|nr:hypothetical protein GCM10007937_14620 [Mesorhizobium albiziae]
MKRMTGMGDERPAGEVDPLEVGTAPTRRVADWLCLAATPTFAVMAVLTAAGGPDIICSAMPDASPLSGMGLMYVLMSIFHLAPWLKLAASRRIASGSS